MKITNAVNRIYWRFGGNGNKNPLPINQQDLEAYQRIKEYVVEKEKEQFANNELFAKMFILMYMKVLEKDGTTVYDKHARRKICDFLQLPMANIIEKFTNFMNDMEVENLFSEIGIKIKHPLTQSDQERYVEQERLKEALKKPENEKRFMREVWDEEFVGECLRAEVNQAIEICG